MIYQPLGSVAKIIAGQSPPSSTYNSVGDGLPFFQGKADFQEMYPRVRMWCTSTKRKEAEPGDILISVRAPVGAVNICNQKSIIGRGLSAIRPKLSLDRNFLYYYLKANEKQIDALGTGSTFKAITQDTLQKIKIPLPPLDDQKRIAYLLSKVEGLIAQRKQHLQHLDDLLKSVFLEMFGDPVRNEKGWEDHLFSNLFSSSPRIGTTKPASPDGIIPVVRVGELGEFQVNFKNCKKVALEKDELEKCRVEEGDILLARAIASQSHLGKASLITKIEQDIAFDSHVMRIRFKEQLVNPVFAYNWLKSDGGRNRFLNAGGQTSVQFNINSKQISSIKIPLPPIELQNQFATIVEKVESIKTRYQASLTDLENLYGALSQKAFKGELDLSRVPLPPTSPNQPTGHQCSFDNMSGN